MEIEDVVGVKFGTENEVDMEEKGRGWDLEDIAGDSLRHLYLSPHLTIVLMVDNFVHRKGTRV
jgi:hypothetical protein